MPGGKGEAGSYCGGALGGGVPGAGNCAEATVPIVRRDVMIIFILALVRVRFSEFLSKNIVFSH